MKQGNMPSAQANALPECEAESAHEILNRFIGIPEQTYEEFLGTFSHLPTERKHGLSHAEALHRPPVGPWKTELTVEMEEPPVSATEDEVQTSEDQIVMDDGIKAGGCHSINLPCAYRVQIDNYLDPCDFATDIDDSGNMSRDLDLLPGEAETTCYHPSFSRSTQLDFHTAPPSQQHVPTHQTDEVQSFALEDGFDYDRVTLTPKFSETELKFLENQEKPASSRRTDA
ncbi:intraflagellar transport-associated protein [Pelodytes ibericus]